MRVSFILTGEGSSDLNLVNHIENALIDEGFTEVRGEIFNPSAFPVRIGHEVANKLRFILKLYPSADVIFVHRDADNAGLAKRLNEIQRAAALVGAEQAVIPVIPICMLETWLLTDITAIRRVSGNANGKHQIPSLPEINRLEQVKNSKSLLDSVLCEASSLAGNRLKKFRSQFSQMRARLTLELDVAGPVNGLPSYQDFRKSLRQFHEQRSLDGPANIVGN